MQLELQTIAEYIYYNVDQLLFTVYKWTKTCNFNITSKKSLFVHMLFTKMLVSFNIAS